MRQFESVPDLKGRRAGRVFEFSITEGTSDAGSSWVFTDPNRGYFASGPAFPAATAALYDERRRVANIKLDSLWRGGEVRVSDSGRYVVLLSSGSWNNAQSPLVSIYRSDGSLVRSLFPDDVLSPNDLLERINDRLRPSIRENDESGRDLLLLTIPESSEAIRIDLPTGSRLGEIRDVLSPRIWATPAARLHFTPEASSGNPTCVDGAKVPADAIALDSAQLVARAIDSPLPEYPRVARLARQRGTVSVEVIVSENGRVLCARASDVPFGLSPAAEAAARGWRFTPYLLDGKPVKIRGEIEFHFDRDANALSSPPG